MSGAALDRLIAGEPLTEAAVAAMTRGEWTDDQIAASLKCLRERGETAEELAAMVRALRAAMVRVEAPGDAIDVCGTGGFGFNALNVSTAATFVLAGMGVPVAKHGNRASAGGTGSADVMEALGVGLHAPPQAFPEIMAEAGCGFLFAPNHHPALKKVAAARRLAGGRNLFNFAAPLANPAGVRRQLVGVAQAGWMKTLAEALADLGAESAWIVHGGPAGELAMDELTISGTSEVITWEGRLCELRLSPEDAGLPFAPLESLTGGDAAHNAKALLDLLHGCTGPYRDTVLLNAAAAATMAGRAPSVREGVSEARRSIDSGAARVALEKLRRATARWREPHAA